MLKKQLIKNILLGGLVATSIAFGSFQASAANLKLAKSMSSEEFYSIVEKTESNQIATNFGMPDNIVTLRGASGDMAGVVWVYREAVLKEQVKMDASFVIVEGEFKYVTLSDVN